MTVPVPAAKQRRQGGQLVIVWKIDCNMKMTGLIMLALLGVAAPQGYEPEGYTAISTFSGILYLEGNPIIFRDGNLRMTGPLLNPGEQGDFTIEAGFATSASGEIIQIDGGRITGVSIPSTDTQAISDALATSGVTVDQFIQQVGTIPPQNGVFEIISGVAIVSGVYYEVNVGVVVLIAYDVLPTGGVQPTVDLAVEQTRTVFVTEAYQTTTVFEPVTLTKYSTSDVFVTVVAPIYNTYDATLTNFVRQTVNVAQAQVVRSQAAGNVVVNTVTVPSQTVVVVRDTSTNFLVQTAVGDAVRQLEHVATNFAFSTVTINIPVTSSIYPTITRTSVVTAFVTATVGSTIFTTHTVVVTQATQIPGGY